MSRLAFFFMLALCLVGPALAQPEFLVELQTLAQQRDLARLGHRVQLQPDESLQAFLFIWKGTDRLGEEDTYFLNALARALELAGQPFARDELKRRNLLFLPSAWEGTAFEFDPQELTRRSVPQMLAPDALAPDPARERRACLELAIRVGDLEAARKMLASLGTSDPEVALLQLVARERAGLAAEVLSSGPALRERAASPEQKLDLELAMLLAAHWSGLPREVDRGIQAVGAAASGSNAPSARVARFVAGSLARQRLAEQSGRPSFPEFLASHQEVWSELDGLDVRRLRTGEARWICQAAWVWLGQALDLAAAQSEEFPVRAQLDYLVRRDLGALERMNREAFEQSFGVQPSRPHQFLELWNPEFSLGTFELQLDMVSRLLERGETREAAAQLASLGPARVELERHYDEAGLAFQMAQYGALYPPGSPPPPPGAPPDPFLFTWNQGDTARLLGRYHVLRARLGQAYERRADLDLARKYLERTSGFLGLEDWRWVQLEALAEEKAPEPEQRKLVESLLRDSQQRGYRPGQIEGLIRLGELQGRAGSSSEAAASLRQAVDLIEQLVLETGGAPETVQQLKTRYRRAYDRLTELLLKAGRSEEALAVQSRFTQVEGLAGLDLARLTRGGSGTREAGEKLEDLRAARALAERARGAGGAGDGGLLAQSRKQFYLALQELRARHPDYERMLAVRPVNFSHVQPGLPQDAAIVQLFPSEEALYLFVLTSRELTIHQVPVTRAQLQAAVASCRRGCLRAGTLNPGDPLLQDLGRLDGWIIEPLQAELQGKKLLAFVPTGFLHYLPFAALADTGPEGQPRFLVERYQVAVLHRSSDLENLSHPPAPVRGGLLAVGNPDGSLPAAGEEARALQGLFPGATVLLQGEATRQNVLAATPSVSYLHLATHGILNSDMPTDSYLVLAPAGGDETSGRLDVGDIADLRLEGARLVTLSACQTGLGEREPGSEIATLADAFAFAGSPSLVASLWKVSDESTRDLMVGLYQNLKQGSSLAEALQASQLKLLRDPRTRHPFYWAPFELMGDWR